MSKNLISNTRNLVLLLLGFTFLLSVALLKTLSEIREEPGMSNAGKYKDVAADDFAGPHGTYPINTEARGKSAIKLAHNDANPEAIKAKVYKKYPELKPEIGVQSPNNNSKTA